MVRFLFLVLTILVAFLSQARAQSAGVLFDKDLKTELTERTKPKFANSPLGQLSQMFWGFKWAESYAHNFPVNLKAGQDLEINVTVVGAERMVAVALLDKTGKIIAKSPEATEKFAQLKIKEVNADGMFQIIVLSDRIGPLTILPRVTNAGSDLQSLKEKEARLLKDLEEVRKQIVDLTEKSGIKSPR